MAEAEQRSCPIQTEASGWPSSTWLEPTEGAASFAEPWALAFLAERRVGWVALGPLRGTESFQHIVELSDAFLVAASVIQYTCTKYVCEFVMVWDVQRSSSMLSALFSPNRRGSLNG